MDYAFTYDEPEWTPPPCDCTEFVVASTPGKILGEGGGSLSPVAVKLSALDTGDASADSPWSFSSAPDGLVRWWPSAVWPFDEGGFTWVYIGVGRDPDVDTVIEADEVMFQGCSFPKELGDDAITPYVVFALQPYAVYQLLSFEEATDSLPDGSDTPPCGRFLRIRFWVGVTNHFSAFVQPDEWTGQSTLDASDLPPDLYGQAGHEVRSVGELCNLVTSMMVDFQFTIGWTEDGTGLASTAYYSCNPGYRRTPPGMEYDSYALSDGSPSPIAYSNPSTVGDPSSSRYPKFNAMAALMGHVAEADVCVVVPEGAFDIDATVREAFEKAFGEVAVITFEARHFGPGGSGEPGLDYFYPYSLVRTMTLSADDLRPAWALEATVGPLRATSEGKWVFRSRDSQSIGEAQSAAAGTTGCSCKNY